MSIIFILLKVLRIWDTPFDWAIFLVLLDLDIITFCCFLSWWKLIGNIAYIYWRKKFYEE